jgi:predicted DNA-binding transcriptional regulator AlpA
MSAVEFLLKRPSATDDFVAEVCRLVRNGEEIMNVIEAAEAAGLDPKAFLDSVASDPDFPKPLFRKEHKAVWRKADVEAYLARHEDRNG